MKKKTIMRCAALGLALMCASAGLAKTQMSVNFGSEAQPRVFEITDATVLSFSTNPATMTVKADSETSGEAVALGGVQSITFAGAWSGIGQIAADIQGDALALRQNPVEGVLEVLAPATGDLSVYSLSGAELIRVKGWKGQGVDVSALNPGIYVVTVDKKSAKFIKR